MVCTIRPLSVKEADILASAQGARKTPAVLNKLLAACVESVENAEPYSSPINWDQVLVGDRTYLLLQIRKVSLGSEYLFKAQCGAQGCNNRFEWEVNLDDMELSKLTEEQRHKFQNGNKFETSLPDGTPVFFRLPTGADEKKALTLKAQHPDSMVTLSLRLRIAEIQGVVPQDLRKYISALGLREANHLIDKFDEVDCGIETTIEIECPECYALSDVTLPFDQSFFFPSQQSTQRKRRNILEAV